MQDQKGEEERMKKNKKRRLGAICILMMTLLWAGCTCEHEAKTDKEKITRQIQNHHYYWDGRELDKFFELFTADVVTHSYITGKTEAVWTSPDLETLSKASRSYLETLEGIQTRHHPSGIQFLELTETTATTLHTALITQKEQGEPQPKISMSATYKIYWTKNQDNWLIRQRDFYKD